MLLAVFAIAILTPVSDDAFADDARLAMPVSHRADCALMEDLLSGLSEKLGVELTVASDIREDLIALRVHETPAREVLQTIAAHFDWTWERRGEGYRLVRRDEQRQAEEAALREILLDAYGEVREAARRDLMAGTDPGQRARLQAEYENLMAQTRPLVSAVDLPYSDQRWATIRSLQGRLSPAGMLVRSVIAGMTDAELLELEERRRLVYASRPTPAQKPLNTQAEKYVEPTLEIARTPFEWNPTDREAWVAAEKQAYGSYLRLRQGVDPGAPASLRLILTGGRYMTASIGASMSYRLEVLDDNGKSIAMDAGYLPDDGSVRQVRDRRTELQGEVQALRAPLSLNERQREVLGPHPDWPGVARALIEAMRDFRQAGSKTLPQGAAGAMITTIAEAAGVNLVASLYDFLPCRVPPVTSVAVALDSLARDQFSVWRFEDGWLHFQKPDRALARAWMPPPSVVFEARDRTLRNEGVSIDDLATYLARLTNRQAISRTFVRAFPGHSPTTSEAHIHMLRMWAALGEGGRAALRRGGQITYGRMPPAAGAEFAKALYLLEPVTEPWLLHRYIDDEAELALLSRAWSISGEGDVGRLAEEITQVLPNGPLIDSAISLRVIETRALAPVQLGSFSVASYDQVSQVIAATPGQESDPFDRPLVIREAVYEVHAFSFLLFSGSTRGTVIATSRLLAGGPYKGIEGLPAAARERVNKQIEYIKRESGGPAPPPPPGGS